jgi:hypothetical protein
MAHCPETYGRQTFNIYVINIVRLVGETETEQTW